MARRKTIFEFIKDSKKIWGNKWDYSHSNYINNKTPVKILCSLHGFFYQKPIHHLNGSGCPNCSNLRKGKRKTQKRGKINKKLTTSDFIKRSNEIHNFFYDYSLSDYKNMKTKLYIICPIHGAFLQKPYNHIHKKSGCGKCAIEKLSLERKESKEILKQKLEYLFGKEYYFDLRSYKNSNCLIDVKCKKHGWFKQYIKHLKMGILGCSSCIKKISKGELKIKEILDKKKIYYEREKKFKDLKLEFNLRFDFYLPNYNIVIEYDGEQHYKPIKWFGGNKVFKTILKRDSIKKEWCEKKNIKLIRISYELHIS